MAILRNPLKRTNSPLHPVSGVQRVAQGNVDGPPPDTSGLEVGTAVGDIVASGPAQLSSWQGSLRTYQKMMDDATVNSTMALVKTPILGADFYFDPASDDQQDLDAAEFVTYNILNGMTTSWLETLVLGCTKFEFGFSVFEQIWELREWAPQRSASTRKQYTMLRKLAWRPQSSILDFSYDTSGGPAGVVQAAAPGQTLDATGQATNQSAQTTNKLIKIDKLLILTNNKQGANLEGRSTLRSAYEHWFYKHGLYKIDAIQKERHGIGIPEVELPVNPTEEDKVEARKMMRNLRTNHNAYIVKPNGWTVGFAELSGNPVNALASAEHHDLQILGNVLATFVGDSSGTKSSSGTLADLFMKASRVQAELICGAFNQYVIPRLVAFNFPVVRFPQMKARNVGETRDIQTFSAGIANLLAQKGITPDLELENWLRDIIDAPMRKTPRPVEVPPVVVAPGAPAPPNGKPAPPPSAQPPPPPTPPTPPVPPARGNVPTRTRPGNTGIPPNAGG